MPDQDLGATQRSAPLPDTQPNQPTHAQGLPPAQPPTPPPPHPRPPQRSRRNSGFYLPLWSVAIMLVVVLSSAFCMAFAVVSLGGQSTPGGQPRVVILTAAPNSLVSNPADAVSSTPSQSGDLGIQAPPATFAMEGPTLPPVVFSPTPETIAVGKTVIVSAPESGLNVRSGPSRTDQVLFVAPDQQTFVVIGGPQTSDDGLIWWEVQNPDDSSQSGWAAQSYLEIPKQ